MNGSLRRAAAFAAVAFALVLGGSPGTASAANHVARPMATSPTGAGQSGSWHGLRPLTIQTTPTVVGARFVLDGKALVTGATGSVTALITKSQRTALAQQRDAHLVVATPTVMVASGIRARFAGWYDRGYHFSAADRSGQVLAAAFDFDYLTSFSFVGPTGRPIGSSSVGAMQLGAGGSRTIDLPKPAPRWLRGEQITSVGGLPVVREQEYSVLKVVARGNNVVHRGQQRFYPSHRQNVTVKLLFFTVRFATRDALFGNGTGSAINLKFADGTVRRYPLTNAEVTVRDLPRGPYDVTVSALGLKSAQSLVVSQDQTATIQVITAVDLAAVVGVVSAIALSLLMIGRSLRRRRRRRRGHPPNDDDRLPGRSSQERVLEHVRSG